uniref:Uncharacterized protein n=1 Tax=Anguilla anguilla TaxID=7936 RepID=A0A0E9SN67_ANGAN
MLKKHNLVGSGSFSMRHICLEKFIANQYDN